MNTPRLKTLRISCGTLFVVVLLLAAGTAIPISSAAVSLAQKKATNADATPQQAPESYTTTMATLKEESPPGTAGLLAFSDLQIRNLVPAVLLERFAEFYARSQQYLGDPSTLTSGELLMKLRAWLSGFSAAAADPSETKGLAMTHPGLLAPTQFNYSSSTNQSNYSGGIENGSMAIDNSSAFGFYWKNYTKALSLFSMLMTNNYVQWSKRVKVMLAGLMIANVLGFMMIGKRMRTTPHQDRFMRFSFLLTAAMLAVDALAASYAVMGMSTFDKLTNAEANIVVRIVNADTLQPIPNLQGNILVQSLDALAQNGSVEQFTYLLGCDGTNLSQGFYSLHCREAAEDQPCYLKAPPPPGVWRLRVDINGFRNYTLSQTPPIDTHGTFYGTVLLRPN
jgi:hypothetical protein